jgi:MFS family permease
MSFTYSRDPGTDRSLRHSVRDGVAYSVMAGGAETYLSAFALFLRATTAQVALVATVPPLAGAFFQFLAAWLGHRFGRRKPVILAGAVLQMLMWLPLLVLPVLFPQHAVALLVACLVIYYAGSNLAAPLWASLMGDLVPERKRGRFFGRRTRLATITSFISLAVAGAILYGFDRIGHTGLGFALVFGIAALARLVSVYHLLCMHEPEKQGTLLPGFQLSRQWLQTLRHSHALRFSLYLVCMQAAVGVSAPFFAVYMLRDLQYNYIQFMANTGTAVLVQFLMLNTWGRISDVFGNRLILVTTGSMIPFLPLLWLVSGNFWYLIGVQVISGFAWAGFSLSAGNFLYDLIPGARRATAMAFHNVFVAIGVFLGGMLGALLSRVAPVEWDVAGLAFTLPSVLLLVFAASASLRILVAVLFLPRLREVRQVRRTMTARQLVFRVTRFNAFSGLLYDVVTMFRRGRGD